MENNTCACANRKGHEPTPTVDTKNGIATGDTFSRMYPVLNAQILRANEQDSRDGKTYEVLDFKTHLTNPYRRCVGGNGRNINIFFLLAEAIWIAAGQKDVEFLTLFNKNMSNFSDDGKAFHAPYGHRLRHWGVRAEDQYIEENMHASQGYDQVADAIRLLTENPDTRQVVMTIWNPDFDLGVKSKDLPCNDMVMLKIRDGKLITTIQNRSNDLHWGLPTNIFQFSFLTELMAGVLGVELGTQTHNSHSLHIYDWSGIAKDLDAQFKANGGINGHDLYDYGEERRMDFNFAADVPSNRLKELDFYLSVFIRNIKNVAKRGSLDDAGADELQSLKNFSRWLYDAYILCEQYVIYQNDLKHTPKEERDEVRREAMVRIGLGVGHNSKRWDVALLALNFYASRIEGENGHSYLGKL